MLDQINLSDIEFWRRTDRDACFAKLRRERPVAWYEEFDVPGLEAMKGPGYWAVTRYADVMHVSRHPELFASVAQGRPGGMPPWGTQLGDEKIWKVLAYLETLPRSSQPGMGAPGVAPGS